MIGCGICNPTNVNGSTQKITYYAGLDVIGLIPCLIFISTQNNFNNLPRSGDLCSRCLEINMQIRQKILDRENIIPTLFHSVTLLSLYQKDVTFPRLCIELLPNSAFQLKLSVAQVYCIRHIYTRSTTFVLRIPNNVIQRRQQ